MGLFVEKRLNATPLRSVLEEAYRARGMDPDAARQAAEEEAGKLAERVAAGTRAYDLNRIIFAVAFFFLLLVTAIAAEAFDWVEDPVRIYDFAGLVLAVVIGYIGGEGAS